MIPFHLTTIQLVTLLVAVLLPLVTAYFTGVTTHPGVKAVVLVVLSAITGFGSALLTALQSGKPFDLTPALLTFSVTLLIGINAHFGIWKPTTLSAILQNTGPTLFASSTDGTPAVTAVQNPGAHAAIPDAPAIVYPAGTILIPGSDPAAVADPAGTPTAAQ